MSALAKKRKRARGETLIETMVAMAIFTVAMLGILEMNIFAHGQLGAASRETKVANLGRDLIDAFDRLPFDCAAFAVGDHALSDTDLVDDSAGTPLLGAAGAIAQLDLPPATTVTWTCVADNDADGNAQGVKIAITLTFKTVGGQSKPVQFATYKYNVATVVGGPSGTPEI
jgi:type IV pilus assembly protein PilV